MPSLAKPTPPSPDHSLIALLREAYPSATDRLLAQAIAESRKELGAGADPESLLRCVRERITA